MKSFSWLLVSFGLNDDMLQAGKFFSTVGVVGFIQATVCSGMSPITSFSELVLQMLLMGLLRLVSALYLVSFEKIILNCTKMRDKNKKSE